LTDSQGRSRRRLTATVTDLEIQRQQAMLVALAYGSRTTTEAEQALDELERLTDTAGSDTVGRFVQQRARPDPATFIGKGKAEELAAEGRQLDIDLLVVDGELSPVQQRNLQLTFGCDVVDRIALILDIFAQHAHSREGMAQVELALLRYRLPRLRGRGIELSRLGGGIGTRGPGETQLETDRRRVLGRISTLERLIENMSTSRETRRKARRKSGMSTIALVGYTNAGKSSILNRLTGADVLVEDQLFSTLDATTRRLELPSRRVTLVSDTVGFVRDLPHQLIEAFRSTLEEAIENDLLVHVVDAAADTAEDQIAAVRATLADIGAADLPEVMVLNKADIASPVTLDRLRALYPDAITVSAATGEGTTTLTTVLDDRLAPNLVDLEALIPYDHGELIAAAHQDGEVLAEAHEEAGVRIKARIPAEIAYRYEPFST
jgi:GTP-binding protein HflX